MKYHMSGINNSDANKIKKYVVCNSITTRKPTQLRFYAVYAWYRCHA